MAENEITRSLPGKYVDTFAFPDGCFEVRWQGVSVPYSVFTKISATHAAITENKRLSAVLEHIKAGQDKAAPKKRRAGKQRRAISQPESAIMVGISNWLEEQKTGRGNAITNSGMTKTAWLVSAAIYEVSAQHSHSPPL